LRRGYAQRAWLHHAAHIGHATRHTATGAAFLGRLGDDRLGDEATGVNIVRRSVVEPLRWIAENAGQEGYVIVEKVRGLQVGHGFNAATGEYGDLIAGGVIDPVKVTRSALINAASIAAMVLTTDTLVVEKKEPEPAAEGGHGHGHGH